MLENLGLLSDRKKVTSLATLLILLITLIVLLPPKHKIQSDSFQPEYSNESNTAEKNLNHQSAVIENHNSTPGNISSLESTTKHKPQDDGLHNNVTDMLEGNHQKSIMVFAAHEDDEAIGVGGKIIRTAKDNGTVHVVIMTDGSPDKWGGSEEYSLQRVDETKTALAGVGVPESNIIFLMYDDLGFIFDIDFSKEADKISQIIANVSPDEIYIPAYEGGHIDHDATHLLGLEGLRRSNLSRVLLFEYIEYNYFHWGAPIPDNEDQINNAEYPIITLNLSEDEIAQKKEMLRTYASQEPTQKIRFALPPKENEQNESTEPEKLIERNEFHLNEYELYMLNHPNPSAFTGNLINEGCEDYLTCTYYWPDMIRFLPVYNYTTRPHHKPVEYELDKEYLNKTFEDLRLRIQIPDNRI
jgi:LmbE family N-acetylglucosaminyl deacetylase